MKSVSVVALLVGSLIVASAPVRAEEYIVNAQTRAFAPDILYVQPGDSVQWVNMTSHNTVSQDVLLPEGAQGWRGALGENLSITPTVEGVYPYVCEPHIGFGMVGVIVVGKPVNIDVVMVAAEEKLQGPFRRLIPKLAQVQQAAQQQ
jgi:pseudoazurin